jgi:hypothetical protein
MSHLTDFSDIPGYSQADYEAMTAGYDDSKYCEPVIIDTPTTAKKWQPLIPSAAMCLAAAKELLRK